METTKWLFLLHVHVIFLRVLLSWLRKRHCLEWCERKTEIFPRFYEDFLEFMKLECFPQDAELEFMFNMMLTSQIVIPH